MKNSAIEAKKPFNISNLLKVIPIKIKATVKIFLVLLSILFFSQGCDGKTAHPEEERVILEKFFRFLLLNESGIFTLLGSKPMTKIEIIHEDCNCKKLRWDSLTEEEKRERLLIINKDDPQDIAFFKNLSKDLRRKVILLPDSEYVLDQSKIIKNWGIIEKLNLSKNYILKRKESSFNTKYGTISITYVYFVNVAQTAYILQKHYDTFKNAVGFDFDPVSVVSEFKETKSNFWEALEGSEKALLWGLLYGYGYKNAYFFHHKNIKEHPMQEISQSFEYEEFSANPTIKNFPIPVFASFSKNDTVIKRYRKERNIIKKEYANRNFFGHTLKILTKH
jgi:hypothetical protein